MNDVIRTLTPTQPHDNQSLTETRFYSPTSLVGPSTTVQTSLTIPVLRLECMWDIRTNIDPSSKSCPIYLPVNKCLFLESLSPDILPL